MPETDAPDLDQRFVRRILDAARHRLGMEVAWFSHVDAGQQRFRLVAAASGATAPAEGGSAPYEGSYCARVVEGRLPNLVPDAAADERTASLPITDELAIGAYLGVPVRLADEHVYGMLCCVSPAARTDLGPGDVRFLEVLADLVAVELDAHAEQRAVLAGRRARIERALDAGGIQMVFQPLVDLRTGRIVGAEALARFAEPPTAPDRWFADAVAAGLSAELQLAAVRGALDQLDGLPGDVYLAVNASPDLLLDPALHELLVGVPAGRVVVEITEHTAVDDYVSLVDAVERLRSLGVRLAIDDAGAGFSSFRHVLRLRPDIIKLDLSISRDVDRDPVRRALAEALVSFAGVIGASIVAEGVETVAELDALLGLGVGSAQGYYLARPGPLPLPVDVPGPTPRSEVIPGGHRAVPTFVAQAAASATDLESLARPLLDVVLELTGLEAACITVLDDEGAVLEHRFVRAVGGVGPSEGEVERWDESLARACLERGIRWTAAAPDDLPGADGRGVQTYVSIPVEAPGGRLLGTLDAASGARRYVGEGTVRQLELFAHLLADRVARDEADAAAGRRRRRRGETRRLPGGRRPG